MSDGLTDKRGQPEYYTLIARDKTATNEGHVYEGIDKDRMNNILESLVEDYGDDHFEFSVYPTEQNGG